MTINISTWIFYTSLGWLKFHSFTWHEIKSAEMPVKRESMFGEGERVISHIRQKNINLRFTLNLTVVLTWDTILNSSFSILWNSLNFCWRQVFCFRILLHARCEHWTNIVRLQKKTKIVVHQFKLNIETFPCSLFWL